MLVEGEGYAGGAGRLKPQAQFQVQAQFQEQAQFQVQAQVQFQAKPEVQLQVDRFVGPSAWEVYHQFKSLYFSIYPATHPKHAAPITLHYHNSSLPLWRVGNI